MKTATIYNTASTDGKEAGGISRELEATPTKMAFTIIRVSGKDQLKGNGLDDTMRKFFDKLMSAYYSAPLPD